MLRSRFVAPALALVVLVGCTGGNDDPQPSPSPSMSLQPGERGVDGQRVVLGHGATVVAMRLARICDDTGCSATPKRPKQIAAARLSVDDARPVLSITFEIAPEAIEGRIDGPQPRSEPEALDPGTLVAWRPLLPEGRSELRVIATYGTQRLEWRATMLR